MMVSYNLVTVPSVSLEGRSIWLVKSLPVATREILDSKILFHLILTLPVSVLTHIVICAAAGADPAGTASSLLFVVVYNFASAALGMIIALKMPNLNYTDEASAIKQNWGVTIVMFGGMIAVAVLAFLYFIVSSFIPAWLFAVLASLLFAGLSAIEFRWIYTRGIIIFEEL